MHLDKLERIVGRMTRYNDIGLAFLIVAIIGLMIIPLPTVLVDGLIASNLMLAVVMLMVAIYIPSALSFSVFPSMLLFSTLFRLALNISTTRLILLKANAGEIIYTFGNFVVAGNFVVGAVIFLILTIVQFLVIAKGSERVAEVSARFTLDAMPGKQMSIDADMRAGVIDVEEARKRRSLVTKESQMYGAMDGAMKFVKGDAIAGFIVTAVNILGGIVIGITQNGMTTAEALQTYAILTIGDGLVSQIPALLISITAGIVVTRVSSEEDDNLGEQIGKQFLAQPKALLIGGALLLLFALIPGFPKPQFIVLATILGGTGFILYRKHFTPQPEDSVEDQLEKAMAPAGDSPAPRSTSRDTEEFSITVPLIIDLSESVRTHVKAAQLNDEVIRLRKALYYDLGVPFPGIHLRFRNEMQQDSYTILLQEIPMSKGWLPAGKVLVREPARSLDMMGFKYETGEQFLPGAESIWVESDRTPLLDKAGMTYLTSAQVLTFHLSFLLKKHAETFIGMQETRYLLTQMDQRYSELVKEVQRIMPIQKIAEILQRLVQEQISIRNLRTILESFIEWGQKEKDSVMLTEYVRTALKRQISYQYSGGQNVLSAYMLDPSVEETIRNAIRQTSSGSYLALPPETSSKIVTNLVHEVGDLEDRNPRPVLITSMDIRRYVRKMIELELYELPVLSYQELTQEITIQPLGKVMI